MKNNNDIIEALKGYYKNNPTDTMKDTINKIKNNTQIIKEEFGKTIKSMYMSGAGEQQSLFEIEGKEYDVTKVYRLFHLLVNEEAKQKNIQPMELLDYFTDNPMELKKLIKTQKENKLLNKKIKFKQFYIHKELDTLTRLLFSTQKLKNTGAQEGFQTWEGKGVQYLIRAEDLPMLKGKNPKTYVSQLKNIDLLIGLTQEQQYYEDYKNPECEFTLSYYAERRGYTKDDIQRGGKFWEELKRDLLTGAYTTYKLDKIKINGKIYTAHGIPNVYTLYEPEDKGIPWKVVFVNEPWKTNILEILNGKHKQFFIEDRQAIEDRTTTDNPYLYLFYRQLQYRKQRNLITMPVKVKNLLHEMKRPNNTGPKECYEILKECLIYFSTHYEPVPEIESFYIYNDFHKTDTIKLPGNITEAFKNYPYEDYKGLLKAMGIDDIKEAFISFKRPYKKPQAKKQQGLNDDETRALQRTLKWFDGKITKIPREDQESIIKMYIKKLGYDNYLKLFDYEANKLLDANAFVFLKKTLPDSLKEDKDK